MADSLQPGKQSNGAGPAFERFERIGEQEHRRKNLRDVMSLSDITRDAYYNFNNKYKTHVMIDSDVEPDEPYVEQKQDQEHNQNNLNAIELALEEDERSSSEFNEITLA